MNKQQAGTFALGAAAATLSLLLAKAVFGGKRNEIPTTPVSAATSTTTTTVEKIVPESELSDPAKLRQGFLDVFEELVEFLKQDMKENYEVIDRHIQYVDKLIRYNCLGGKYNRGLYVQQTLINMKKGLGQPVTEDELKKARVLGWAIEWLQAFFLVADDIMDNGDTRRGQPCWFRLEEVKITACNDYIILESHMYRLLKKYFYNKQGDNATFMKLVDLFHEVTYQTEIGQLNDLRLQIAEKKQETSGLNLDLFDMTNYQLIVKYKTAFYSFYLPLACGLVVAGVDDEKIFEETKNLSVKMGEYFQIQDDFLDCYADPAVLGKVGRDIEEAKCGWLVVQALKRCTPEQRQIIQENYGVNDPAKVQKIKALYKELDMEKIFADYEEAAVKEMNAIIDSSILKSRNQHNAYVSALSLIVKRKK